MNWIELSSESDLNKVIKDSSSTDNGVAIFKHSTRCPISSMAKNRLSSKWDFNAGLPIYYLDLIKHRDLSKIVAQKFSIQHESPQLLLIKNGECIYDSSHGNVSVDNLRSFLKN